MILLIISSASIVGVLGMVLWLVQFAVAAETTMSSSAAGGGKMKRDDSDLCLTGSHISVEDYPPVKIGIYGAYQSNYMDLRQRPSHNLSEATTLPRPQYCYGAPPPGATAVTVPVNNNNGAHASNQDKRWSFPLAASLTGGSVTTALAGSAALAPLATGTNMNYNTKWQKLNSSPMARDEFMTADSFGSGFARNHQYNNQNNNNCNNHIGGDHVGLKGTKPLITINRLDLLTISRSSSTTNESHDDSSTMEPIVHHAPRKPTSPRNVLLAASVAAMNAAVNNGNNNNSSSELSHMHAGKLTTIRLKDLSIDVVIGGGGFGQVWRGCWNGTPVAVKILNSACQTSVPENVLSDFEEEVNMLARLRHPNICMFLGVCLEPPNRAIVTELAPKGTLWELLRTPALYSSVGSTVTGSGTIAAASAVATSSTSNQSPFLLPMWITRRVLEETLRGLIYLHNQAIIHRDLKSANLLLDDSFHVKICDFGLAKLKDFTTVMTAHVGTVQWMSPEVIAGKPYDESADMYSFGMVMWETLTGKCPFEGLSQIDIGMSVVQKGLTPVIPLHCTPAQSQLLKSCWSYSSDFRPTAIQALRALEQAFTEAPAQ